MHNLDLTLPCILAPRTTKGGYPVGQGHRTALEAALGRELEAGHEAHHECRNRACIEPAHLQELTTAAHRSLHSKGNKYAVGNAGPTTDEWKQKISASLTGKQLSDAHKSALSEGQKRRFAASPNPRRKLTDDQVREMRRLAPTTSCKELGARFGVSESTASNVVTGFSYKDVMPS
jgi:hypothetical protein